MENVVPLSPPPFLKRAWPGRVIATRASLTAGALWLLVHVFLFAGSGEIAPLSSFKVLILVVGVAIVAGVVDLRRNKESIFLQNLGVPPFVVPAIWVAVILVLEMMTALLVP